jgi:hypothetical protein
MRALLVAAAAGLALAAPALSARAPTTAERSAITRGVPEEFRDIPAKCVRLAIRISNSSRYATATPQFLHATHMPCLKYAANGYWILRRTQNRWKIVFEGSELPPCSLTVPHDLVSCLGAG